MITSADTLERIRLECRSMVMTRALVNAGVTVVPIPAIDLVADIGILATMLPAISARFELDHDSVKKLEPHLAQRAFAVAAGLGNNVIGRFVTRRLVTQLLRRIGVRLATASIVRYVPLIGSAVAATISFGAMKLAGDAHVEDCYRTALALLDDWA